jgi:hypothetical protein
MVDLMCADLSDQRVSAAEVRAAHANYWSLSNSVLLGKADPPMNLGIFAQLKAQIELICCRAGSA